MKLNNERIKHGYDLILINRSRAKTEPLLGELLSNFPDCSVSLYEADLADNRQIQQAAEKVIHDHSDIHGLIHNAGVLKAGYDHSPEGHYIKYQVNTLTPIALTDLLKPALSDGKSNDETAKVIYVATSAIKMTGNLNSNLLSKPQKYGLFTSYAQSKLAAIIYFTKKCATLFAG